MCPCRRPSGRHPKPVDCATLTPLGASREPFCLTAGLCPQSWTFLPDTAQNVLLPFHSVKTLFLPGISLFRKICMTGFVQQNACRHRLFLLRSCCNVIWQHSNAVIAVSRHAGRRISARGKDTEYGSSTSFQMEPRDGKSVPDGGLQKQRGPLPLLKTLPASWT